MIKFSRVAICAKVDVWHSLGEEGVVAINMLPGIALFTQDGVAIIICIGADTLYGVIFVVWWVGVGESAVW